MDITIWNSENRFGKNTTVKIVFKNSKEADELLNEEIMDEIFDRLDELCPRNGYYLADILSRLRTNFVEEEDEETGEVLYSTSINQEDFHRLFACATESVNMLKAMYDLIKKQEEEIINLKAALDEKEEKAKSGSIKKGMNGKKETEGENHEDFDESNFGNSTCANVKSSPYNTAPVANSSNHCEKDSKDTVALRYKRILFALPHERVKQMNIVRNPGKQKFKNFICDFGITESVEMSYLLTCLTLEKSTYLQKALKSDLRHTLFDNNSVWIGNKKVYVVSQPYMTHMFQGVADIVEMFLREKEFLKFCNECGHRVDIFLNNKYNWHDEKTFFVLLTLNENKPKLGYTNIVFYKEDGSEEIHSFDFR